MRVRRSLRSACLPVQRMTAGLALLLCVVLLGCQTLDDAATAAQQMTTTAATLQAYYDSLVTLVDRDLEAQIAFDDVNGVPHADIRQQLKDTRGSMQQRAEFAAAFSRIATKFTDTTKSTRCSDLSKAISDLNGKVIGLTPLPSTASSGEIAAVKVATNAVATACQAKQDIKAARALVETTRATSALFDKEADVYVSLSESYYRAAAATSNALIGKQEVPATLLFQSSLEPFGLTADITDPDTKQRAIADLKDLVQSRLADRIAETRTATDDLADALHTMRDRINALAARKPLHATRPPFTLEGVRGWIEEIHHDVGEP